MSGRVDMERLRWVVTDLSKYQEDGVSVWRAAGPAILELIEVGLRWRYGTATRGELLSALQPFDENESATEPFIEGGDADAAESTRGADVTGGDEAEGYWQRIWEDVACPNCGASWDLNPDGHPQPGCLCHEPSPEASSPSTEPVKVDVEEALRRISSGEALAGVALDLDHATSKALAREIRAIRCVADSALRSLSSSKALAREIRAMRRVADSALRSLSSSEPDSPADVGIRRRTTDESLTYLGVKIGELDVRLRRLEVPDQEGE